MQKTGKDIEKTESSKFKHKNNKNILIKKYFYKYINKKRNIYICIYIYKCFNI